MPDHVRAEIDALAASHDDLLVEHKGASVALHFRARPELEQELSHAVASMISNDRTDSLTVLPGKAVLEVKQTGFDKASALRRLLAQGPFRDRVPVFIGDDVTDECAIAAAAAIGGLALSVGRAVPGAHAVFDSPAAVRRSLAAIVRASGNPTEKPIAS
ncbi:MAG: trehalose-phosphatase [Burkholderiaceae bacterium]